MPTLEEIRDLFRGNKFYKSNNRCGEHCEELLKNRSLFLGLMLRRFTQRMERIKKIAPVEVVRDLDVVGDSDCIVFEKYSKYVLDSKCVYRLNKKIMGLPYTKELEEMIKRELIKDYELKTGESIYAKGTPIFNVDFDVTTREYSVSVRWK